MMRRSFGSGGMGGGSGSTGGGAVLRTLHRTIRTTTGAGGGPAQEPYSTTSPQPTNTSPRSSSSSSSATCNNNKHNNALCLSSPTNSSSFSINKNPFGGIVANSASWASSEDEFEEWEHVDHDHLFDERVSPIPVGFNSLNDHLVFGSVPSVDEVQHAVYSINQVFDPVAFSQIIKDKNSYGPDKDVPDHITRPTGIMDRIPTVGSEVDWMEPSPNIYNSRLEPRFGPNKVYDAFQLLQTEPSVQRMVISLSSDAAVWDAVLNNEVVQEFRKSLDDVNITTVAILPSAVDKSVAVSSESDEGSDDSNSAMDVLGWIFINTKDKIMDLINKITKMVDELFLTPKSNKKIEKGVDTFDEKLRTSLMLSVVIFLVVVVTRASRA